MCRLVWVSEACRLFLVPSWSSNTPFYPSKCCELGSVPQFFPLPLSFIWGFQRVRSAPAHLDIWNTSYGQKKSQESNCQFDSWLEKIKNRRDLLGCRGCATYRWKALDERYNFAWDRISIRGLLAKLWGSKIAGVLTGTILESPRKEKPFGCRLRGQPQSIL